MPETVETEARAICKTCGGDRIFEKDGITWCDGCKKEKGVDEVEVQ